MSALFDEVQAKLKALNENLWDRRAQWPHVERWLRQFKRNCEQNGDEQIQMLFLASHFVYFGMKEIRALLRSLYRDTYQHDVLTRLRKEQDNLRDLTELEARFFAYLRATRFLGMGNPSESGSHLLYYFRQENRLSKLHFINSHEIFSRAERDGHGRLSLRLPDVQRYVFIDDLCGSGTQALEYGNDLVKDIKRTSSEVRVSYYPLFATSEGIKAVRDANVFDDIVPVVELDPTFKAFAEESRIYKNEHEPISRSIAQNISRQYGTGLVPNFPLGYKDGQLLIGFAHNTPDNTLPIVWFDEPGGPAWTPLFRRFPKQYGWSG